MNNNLILVFAPFFSVENGIYREKLEGRGRKKIGGSKRSTNHFNQAAEMRLWLCFRGHGLARWPHLVGGTPCFSDMALSSSGFPAVTPGFDKTTFDFWF